MSARDDFIAHDFVVAADIGKGVFVGFVGHFADAADKDVCLFFVMGQRAPGYAALVDMFKVRAVRVLRARRVFGAIEESAPYDESVVFVDVSRDFQRFGQALSDGGIYAAAIDDKPRRHDFAVFKFRAQNDVVFDNGALYRGFVKNLHAGTFCARQKPRVERTTIYRHIKLVVGQIHKDVHAFFGRHERPVSFSRVNLLWGKGHADFFKGFFNHIVGPVVRDVALFFRLVHGDVKAGISCKRGKNKPRLVCADNDDIFIHNFLRTA